MVYGIVSCAACGGRYHMVLADRYDPHQRPNGTWFRLLDFYRLNAWSSFPTNDRAVAGADLACPGCGAPYQDVHGRTVWYVDGEKYGVGVKAYERATRPRGAEYSPEFDFFSGEGLTQEQPKKKKGGRPRKNKRKAALKELGKEQADE